jgi:hypothetical protein
MGWRKDKGIKKEAAAKEGKLPRNEDKDKVKVKVKKKERNRAVDGGNQKETAENRTVPQILNYLPASNLSRELKNIISH